MNIVLPPDGVPDVKWNKVCPFNIELSHFRGGWVALQQQFGVRNKSQCLVVLSASQRPHQPLQRESSIFIGPIKCSLRSHVRFRVHIHLLNTLASLQLMSSVGITFRLTSNSFTSLFSSIFTPPNCNASVKSQNWRLFLQHQLKAVHTTRATNFRAYQVGSTNAPTSLFHVYKAAIPTMSFWIWCC